LKIDDFSQSINLAYYQALA